MRHADAFHDRRAHRGYCKGTVISVAQKIGLGICLLAMTSGCAADREVRELASRLRKLTAEYESVTTAKIAAEKKFYLDSLKNLDQTLNVVDPGGPATTDVTKTVAYGRIVTAANRDSQRLAEALASSPDVPLAAGVISDFLRDGVKADELAYFQARQMQAAISEALAIDFAKMADYQKRISELSKGLAQLETPDNSDARLAHLRAIGEAVLIQLRSDKNATKNATQ